MGYNYLIHQYTCTYIAYKKVAICTATIMNMILKVLKYIKVKQILNEIYIIKNKNMDDEGFPCILYVTGGCAVVLRPRLKSKVM